MTGNTPETGRDKKGRFAKGICGNPNGRPPEVRHVRELAREYTSLALNTLVSIAGNSKASPSARVSAATALLDRGYGKPPQEVSLTPLVPAPGHTITDPAEVAAIYALVMGGNTPLQDVRLPALEHQPGADST